MTRRLTLRHAGAPIEISYERKGERIALQYRDRRFEADVSRDGYWFLVRSKGSATRCAVARGKRRIWVACEGRTFVLEEERPEAAAKGAASADELRAPMTGRVIQVVAEKGARVREGDLLLTIEAMKMEFRVVAPEDGVVADVRRAAGERVELGDLLVVLEPRA